MRKIAKAAAALAMGCMLLSTSAFAAMTDNINEVGYLDDGIYEVEITGLGGGESTIIVLPEGVALEDADEENILYINQQTIEDGAATYTINLGADFDEVATVYAGGTNMSAELLGTLRAPIPVQSVKLSADKTELAIGEEVTIVVEVLPEDATYKTVEWSENVDPADDGLSATFKAETAGTFKVTATTPEGVQGEIEIVVKSDDEEPKLPEGAAIQVRNADPYEMAGYSVVKVTGIDAGSVAIKDADGEEVPAYLADYTADGGIRQYVAIVKGAEFTTDAIVWNAEGAPETIAFGDGSDLNGAATIGDVSYVLNVVGKVVVITDDNKRFLATDIDGNGTVTIGDVSATLNLVGKIDLIPGAGK